MVGIISDTHGLLRPEAIDCLRGVDLILHAGDVGSAQVLSQLQAIAPVTAVRGNVDVGLWAQDLPLTASVEVAGVGFFLIHDIADLRHHPVPSRTGVVIYGHSHKPSQELRTTDSPVQANSAAVSHSFGAASGGLCASKIQRDGVCYLNPGSAGPRRFSLPVSLVLAQWENDSWTFSFRDLIVKF